MWLNDAVAVVDSGGRRLRCTEVFARGWRLVAAGRRLAGRLSDAAYCCLTEQTPRGAVRCVEQFGSEGNAKTERNATARRVSKGKKS